MYLLGDGSYYVFIRDLKVAYLIVMGDFKMLRHVIKKNLNMIKWSLVIMW